MREQRFIMEDGYDVRFNVPIVCIDTENITDDTLTGLSGFSTISKGDKTYGVYRGYGFPVAGNVWGFSAEGVNNTTGDIKITITFELYKGNTIAATKTIGKTLDCSSVGAVQSFSYDLNDIIGGIDAEENTKVKFGLAPFSGNVDYDRIRISCNTEGSYVDGEDTITVYYATIASVVMCPMPVGLR